MLKISSNQLIFSKELIQLLEASAGDKLEINYAPYEDFFIPVIRKSNIGNKLLGNNTMIFKGNDRSFLLQFGDTFQAYKDNGVIFLKGNKQFKIFNSEKKAAECYLDDSIIKDTNYNIEKFKKFEI